MRDKLAQPARITILQLIYQQKAYEGHAKDYEFSGTSMREHWQSGHRGHQAHPEAQDWLAMPPDNMASSPTTSIATRKSSRTDQPACIGGIAHAMAGGFQPAGEAADKTVFLHRDVVPVAAAADIPAQRRLAAGRKMTGLVTGGP